MAKHHIVVYIKRAYDAPSPNDGKRILVDRLWPRGLSKERAHIDVWLKEVAPSRELRTWFGHQPERFAEFRHRYEQELASQEGQAAFAKLLELVDKEPVTLIFSAKDSEHNNAVVLRDLLMKHT